VLERLKASVPEEASDVHQSISCTTDDDGLHAVRELVLVRTCTSVETAKLLIFYFSFFIYLRFST